MRKFLKPALVIGSMLSVSALAANVINLKTINQRIAQILSPINDSRTNAFVNFSDLKINATRATKIAANFGLTKQGTDNLLNLQVDNVSYSFTKKDKFPVAKASGYLQLDLLKIIKQSDLNEMADIAADIVKSFVSETVESYGAAATVDASVDQVVRNKNNDVTGVRFHLSGQIDLAKLPANVNPNEIRWLSGDAQVSISLTGAAANLEVTLNPEHVDFQKDKMGIKEYIEKLVANDTETYQELSMMISWINDVANSLVEMQPNQSLGRFLLK